MVDLGRKISERTARSTVFILTDQCLDLEV